MTDTIFALSTGTPPAAIGIVRISGPRADHALAALSGRLPEPRRASLATLRSPAGGDLLDRALVLRFPGPATATGEDLVELHLHGGRSVVAAVLAALGGMAGLRLAEAGEFTRRAFENGRIDLAEAEGLADLLMAETDSQRRAALTLAGGALGREIDGWQRRLLGIAATVESALDFSDESDVGEQSPLSERPEVHLLIAELRAALTRPPAERLKDGVRVVIAGPPNAGKSTLFNRLAQREAAITSPMAGTTRDVVEAPAAIGGVPMLLVDTAGLREGEDAIETIGVDRARARIAAADIVLWLGAAADAPDRSLVVAAKCDLYRDDASAGITVSAKTGEGVDALVDRIVSRCRTLLPQEGEIAVNARHRAAIGACLQHVEAAALAMDPIIAAEELRLARTDLDRVTGRAGVETMLDALFGAFCIGK